jgi:hypothetical protein
MSLVERELTVIVFAHLLAVIPIGAFALGSRMSPLYVVPSEQLARWWAWFALIIVASAFLVSSVT